MDISRCLPQVLGGGQQVLGEGQQVFVADAGWSADVYYRCLQQLLGGSYRCLQHVLGGRQHVLITLLDGVDLWV